MLDHVAFTFKFLMETCLEKADSVASLVLSHCLCRRTSVLLPLHSLFQHKFDTASLLKSLLFVARQYIVRFEKPAYLKFAKLQYVSPGFRCRVIAGSLVGLCWPKLRGVTHLPSCECFHCS